MWTETSNRYDNRRCGETLYMTLFSTFFGYVFGMPPWNPAESIRQRRLAAKCSTI